MIRFQRDDLPHMGYPYHHTLMEGLNDTLQVSIVLYNRTTKNFPIKNSGYESWFAPQIYLTWATDSIGPVFRDSTEVGYRVREWRHAVYGNKIAEPDTLRPENSGQYQFKIDLYDLPPNGRFQICMLPTNHAPKNFVPLVGGYVFEYYTPESLCDSVNAYEACFRRAMGDGNLGAAKDWVDQILTISPQSVPGWWMAASRYFYAGDTTSAKDAYDKALEYLGNKSDPCMPDSTQRALRSAEINYLDWIQTELEYARESLGP